MLTKKNQLLENLENNLMKKIKKNKLYPQKTIVLDDDFVPYIVSNIHVTSDYGDRINFYEGNDNFLQVI